MRQVRPHSKSHTAQRLVMRKVSVTTVTTTSTKGSPFDGCQNIGVEVRGEVKGCMVKG